MLTAVSQSTADQKSDWHEGSQIYETTFGSQSGVRATANCVGSTTSYTCSFGGAVVSTCYYRSQPHYLIYRVINGQETLITQMVGSLRSSGSTTSRQICARPAARWPCGAGTGGTIYNTTVNADANGDGRMDYLTNADYAKYFGKYFGWLPAVINSVLAD